MSIIHSFRMHRTKKANLPMRFLTTLLIALCLLTAGQNIHAQATGTVTYVYTDAQGTPLAEANASGTITATFDYTPYGNIASGSAPNGPGYTGHVNDPDTNLVYMQARYYDPSVGRFISTDPVGPDAGGAFNFNRYAYASNNPIINIDPDGMQDCAAGQSGQSQAPCPPPSPSTSPPKPDPKQAQGFPTVHVTATPIADDPIIDTPAIPRWLIAVPNPYVVLVAGLVYPGNMATCQEVSCMPTLVFNLPRGFWPADKGAEEWGRRHGVDPAKARKKFHDIKQSDTTNKGGKREWGVNPETGEVSDPGGEIHGELSE